jgi:hypothetical protein
MRAVVALSDGEDARDKGAGVRVGVARAVCAAGDAVGARATLEELACATGGVGADGGVHGVAASGSAFAADTVGIAEATAAGGGAVVAASNGAPA